MTDSTTETFSRPIDIDGVPAEGLDETLEADEEERAALADRFGVPAVHALSARLRVENWQSGGLIVSGRLAADVEQTCVVTLDPVTLHYDEPVERYYLPAGVVADQPAEPVVDIEGDDEPDVIAEGRIDLGALVTETLALALDPYPRKEGMSVRTLYPELERDNAMESEKENPFAVLERLKDPARSGGAKE